MSKPHGEANRLSDAWRSGVEEAGLKATETAAEKAGQAGEAVGGIAEQAKEKLGEWEGAISDYASQAKDKAQEFAGCAADYATQATHKAQEWACEAADKTGQAAKTAGAEMTDLVRRYPVPALAIGFGLGYLLARATRT